MKVTPERPRQQSKDSLPPVQSSEFCSQQNMRPKKSADIHCIVRLTFAITLIVSAVVPVSGAVAAQSPNIIFILADDLGWRDLGCYGSTFYETPALDRLAGQGLRFTDAYAACNVCSPTRASILTGKYPARLHLTDWLPGRPDRRDQKLKRPIIVQQLPLEEVTIAEALKEAGYA